MCSSSFCKQSLKILHFNWKITCKFDHRTFSSLKIRRNNRKYFGKMNSRCHHMGIKRNRSFKTKKKRSIRRYEDINDFRTLLPLFLQAYDKTDVSCHYIVILNSPCNETSDCTVPHNWMRTHNKHIIQEYFMYHFILRQNKYW